ncbi:DUF4865 family protein [Streptomyces sp. NPDC050560]|uniref:DUF4865 family protein n=1 Tax=Streptomyces sp. NPDC050560 TaxID=3365630 RepID=UPI0037901150
MYAKQYEITLPADYDMGIIRRRVAAAGPTFDGLAGLGLKAYLVRERGRDGSGVNEYAPFYLWNDPGAMARFLVGGGGFQNIVRDFGRRAVRHWTGVACHAGPARAATPRAAGRLRTPLGAEADGAAAPDGTEGTGLGLAALVEREAAALRVLAARPGVHTAALAVDPYHWELVRLTLWEESVPEDSGDVERYRVPHLSAPGLDRLPEGPAW